MNRDISILNLDFASGQEPEIPEDYATLVTAEFELSGRTLARLLGKQMRVLNKALEKVRSNQKMLMNRLLDTDLDKEFRKPVHRLLYDYFVYELDDDPPTRPTVMWDVDTTEMYGEVHVYPREGKVKFLVDLAVLS